MRAVELHPLVFYTGAMRLVKAIAVVSGLWMLGVIIVLGILTINNLSPLLFALWGLAMIAFVPTGFDLCRIALGSGGNEHRLFSGGYRAYLSDIVIMFVAICLTAATVYFQRSSGLLCGGRLGAGFPVAFVCDASGESPLSSVGKLDGADLSSISSLGSSVDVLFYVFLLSVARLAARQLLTMLGSDSGQRL